MESQLGMTSTSYWYEESKPSDDKDDHHIDKVEVEEGDEKDSEDEDVELVEPVNQYMASPALEFEVANRNDQHLCNDQVNIHRDSVLLVDELEVGKKIRDKSECIIAVKQWHIKNSLQFKVHHLTKTYVSLQCIQEIVYKRYLYGRYHQKSNS